MTINVLTITIAMWYNCNNRDNNGIGEENEKNRHVTNAKSDTPPAMVPVKIISRGTTIEKCGLRQRRVTS